MKREYYLKCRLSESEKNFLINEMKKNDDYKNQRGNYALSKYVRDKLIQGSETYIDSRRVKLLDDLKYQVRKIGVNINQCTKAMNLNDVSDVRINMLLVLLEEVKESFDEFNKIEKVTLSLDDVDA